VKEHPTASNGYDHYVGVILTHGLAAPPTVGQNLLAHHFVAIPHPIDVVVPHDPSLEVREPRLPARRRRHAVDLLTPFAAA
jgi:hypothetical protein